MLHCSCHLRKSSVESHCGLHNQPCTRTTIQLALTHIRDNNNFKKILYTQDLRILQHSLHMNHRHHFIVCSTSRQVGNDKRKRFKIQNIVCLVSVSVLWKERSICIYHHFLFRSEKEACVEDQMGVERSTTPKASPRSSRKSNTLLNLFEKDSKSKTGSKSTAIVSASSPSSTFLIEDENGDMLSMISYCTFVFTFTDPQESPSQQDVKRLKLAQILSIIRNLKKPLTDQILKPLVSMIAANLFRPLSSNIFFTEDFPDDEDYATSPSPAWPHIQIIYDILLRLVLNMDSKVLRTFINQTFLTNLLSLFQSEDPRERDNLKNVYHGIYSKFTFYRSFMRKSMNDVFLHFVFENERHCGIAELLEIWGTIINGFTVPLKEEHKFFLMRVLIPMHKPKGMLVYHRQLAYCISQFVQKEPVLGGVIVRGVLRYWPITNCQKEVLLIGELEDLVENIDPEQYRKLALPICAQITKCSNSWNSQVAERALYVWNNEQFVKMASQAMEDVFPVVVEGIEKNLKRHWSKSVRQLTENVKIMLEETDPVLYLNCVHQLELRAITAQQKELQRKERWDKIAQMADKEDKYPHLVALSSECILGFSLREL